MLEAHYAAPKINHITSDQSSEPSKLFTTLKSARAAEFHKLDIGHSPNKLNKLFKE